MSKPPFSDLFRLSGRRNRKSYIQLLVVGIAAELVVSAALAAIVSLLGAETLVWFLRVLVSLFLTAVLWIVAAQRCRDIGWPGLVVAAFLLVGITNWIITYIYGESLASLLLTIAEFLMMIGIAVLPGQRGSNRYGPDPLADDLAPNPAMPA